MTARSKLTAQVTFSNCDVKAVKSFRSVLLLLHPHKREQTSKSHLRSGSVANTNDTSKTEAGGAVADDLISNMKSGQPSPNQNDCLKPL